jgi:hypothetical protein
LAIDSWAVDYGVVDQDGRLLETPGITGIPGPSG